MNPEFASFLLGCGVGLPIGWTIGFAFVRLRDPGIRYGLGPAIVMGSMFLICLALKAYWIVT